MLSNAVIHSVAPINLTLYSFAWLTLEKISPNEKLNKASGNRFNFNGIIDDPYRNHRIVPQQNTI